MTLEQFVEYHKKYESKRHTGLINESKMDDDWFSKAYKKYSNGKNILGKFQEDAVSIIKQLFKRFYEAVKALIKEIQQNVCHQVQSW